jgi:WD40 repeat protein
MNAWTPTPLRWIEKAKAEALRALGALEHHKCAAPPVERSARLALRPQSAALSRLVGWSGFGLRDRANNVREIHRARKRDRPVQGRRYPRRQGWDRRHPVAGAGCEDRGSTTVMIPTARYGAFISYSHAASAEVARGLQKWLQTYAKPWWRWRAVNVFRDETDLTAAPALWSRIADALDESSHFILLASPNAAQSKWIKREIRYWLGDRNAGALQGPDLDAPIPNAHPERIATLLIALTAGDISWDEKAHGASAGDFDWSKTNALPRVLTGVFSEEPQWVDLRTIVQREELRTSLSRSNSEFMRAVAQLAAPIRGISDFSRLVGEDYRQHQRTIRTAWVAAAVLALVTLAAIWQWREAMSQRDQARANLRDTYLAQAKTLRGTLDPVRRVRSLDLVAKAAKLRWTTLRVGNELRDEAVAAMALVELRNPKVWNGYPLGSKGIGFNSNLERYARGDAQGNISIRRIVDDKELMHEPGFGSDPWVLRFSPDDRYLAAKYDGNQLKDQLYVWDLTRPGVDAKYLGKTCESAFDFDPNSQVLAVGRCDGSGSIDIFDLASASSLPTKRLKQALACGEDCLQFVAFRPDGQQLAVSGLKQPAVQVLELNQDKAVLSVPIPTGVRGIAWNVDGGLLAAAADDHRIYVWDVANLRQGSNSPAPLQVLTGHQAEVTQVSFSASDNLLASTAWDETVLIWDPIRGIELIREAGSGPMQFSADGRRLAFIAGAQQLVRWELAAPSEYRAFRSREAPKGPLSAAFSPDGRLLASAHGDGLRIWDLSDNKEIAFVDQTENGDRVGYTRSVLFHPDGTNLITCGPGDDGVPGRGGVYIWPIESHAGGIANALQVRNSRKIDLPKGAQCQWATLGDNGRTLVVAGGRNGQVMLRDLNHSSEWTLLPAVPDVRFVTADPNDRWIAYGQWKGGIWVLDLRTNISKELERSSASFFAAFSPNGKWLVTGSPDQYHVWEVGSWAKPVYELPGYHGIAGLVGALAFSPDGTMLAIARSSSEVELVDANKGWEKIVTLKSPDPASLSWLEFSTDASQLAVVTGAHVIYIWDLREIRGRLSGINLDWELPPYPSSQARVPSTP